MKDFLKKIGISFVISAICGTVVNLLVEWIIRGVTGIQDYIPISQEFVALFPSVSIAVEVNVLLYGLIGAAFSAATFIYEKDSIGFVVQSILYFIMTGVVWIPIVCFIWQLQKNMPTFLSTLGGFLGTYVIMIMVEYRMTKKDVEGINQVLSERVEA